MSWTGKNPSRTNPLGTKSTGFSRMRSGAHYQIGKSAPGAPLASAHRSPAASPFGKGGRKMTAGMRKTR